MATFNGNPVSRPASGANAGRGDDPHGVTHGDEGKTRTQPHPLQGRGPNDTVGTYLGSVGDPSGPRSHMFSAESTGGGASDSHTIHDTDNFKFNGTVGGRYAFSREQGHSGSTMPYNSKMHYGLPGAPMSDTPAKWHDKNYQ